MSFHDRSEWRRPEASPQVELGGIERRTIVVGDGPDDRVVRLVGLDDRTAWPIAPSRPSDRLAQQLVGPLGGTLVGQVQGDVGGHDPD